MRKGLLSMSSTNRVGRSVDPREEIPPAIPSMWRLCRLGYQHEPGLLIFAFVITIVAAVPDALLALWLKFLADGVLDGDRRTVLLAVLAMAVSVTLTWLLRTVSARLTRRFRDKVTIALETHVATLQASVSGIEHHERQEFLDRLDVLRNQIFVLDHMYMSILTTCGWIVRLAVTLSLLASIHPILILLALFALPTVIMSSWRPVVERQVEERYSQHRRRAEHLFSTATTAAAGKEVRVTGIGPSLITQRRAEWERWFTPVSRTRWSTALSQAAAWAVFALGYIAAVVFVAQGLGASVGSVLLILAAGARLSSYVSETVSEIGFLRGTWMDGARRLVWLENYAASFTEGADTESPDHLTDGIHLDQVSFAYPGSEQRVLDDICLHLPAGKVVAVVGENGAGKSTLVKLICKMYEPTSGTILVDGTPLRRIDTPGWRSRIAGAFQDFFRFEFSAGRSIGLGDLPRLEDRPAIEHAVVRAGAGDVIDRLPAGLDTQLGPTWPEGEEVSFGQWQKLALSRGFMRNGPLLLVLDEPTSALDAETEHDLFERYADAVRDRDNGGITLLVSHRFSTVRMADLIVVLDGARLVEVGSHDDLLARNGPYADLYRIQAAAYH